MNQSPPKREGLCASQPWRVPNAADPGGTNQLGYNAGSSRRIPGGVMTKARISSAKLKPYGYGRGTLYYLRSSSIGSSNANCALCRSAAPVSVINNIYDITRATSRTHPQTHSAATRRAAMRRTLGARPPHASRASHARDRRDLRPRVTCPTDPSPCNPCVSHGSTGLDRGSPYSWEPRSSSAAPCPGLQTT